MGILLQTMLSFPNKRAKPSQATQGQARAGQNEPTKKSQGPEQPLSAYIFFLKEKWKEVALNHPGIGTKNIYRLIGNLWSSSSEAEKQPYVALYTQDLERYERQMKQFEAEGCYFNEDGELVTALKRRYKTKSESSPVKKRPPPRLEAARAQVTEEVWISNKKATRSVEVICISP